MLIARQSTARTVMIGPVLDADGVAVTDCVVADFEGSVNGGDPAALNGSATLTHRGVGFYSLALTATDLATVGSFEVSINDTTNGCAIKELTVVEEAVYDALFAASATGMLPSNVIQISGDATAADNAEAFFDGTGYAGTNNVIPLVTTTTTATNVTTVNGLAAGVITAASIAADAITDAKVASDVTIASVTGAVGSVTAGVTVTTNNDKTGYSLTATTGLGNQTADITGSLSGSVGNVTGAVGSVTGAVGSVTGNVGGNVTGSVGSVVGAVGSVTGAVGSVAGGINTAAGTITTLDALDTAQDSQHEITQDQVAEVVGYTFPLQLAPLQLLGSTGNDTTHIHLDGLVYADDELNDHLVMVRDSSDSSKRYFRWITDWVASTELATLHEALPFTPVNVDTAVVLSIRRDADIAAILADTNELQTDWADGGRLDVILEARASQTSVDTLAGYVDTEVAAIKAKTDQLTFTTALKVDATATGVDVDEAAIATAVVEAIADDGVSVSAFTAGAVTQLGTLDQIVVVSPTYTASKVTIFQGADYSASDSDALEWSNTAGTWADLTSATITLHVWRTVSGVDEVMDDVAGSVVTPTGTGQRVRVPLTAAWTSELSAPAEYEFRVRATLTSGRVKVLAHGVLLVKDGGGE